MRLHTAAAFGLAAASCVPPETQATPPEPAAWQVILDGAELDRAVLSAWGAAPDRVFFAGGPLGNAGLDALALAWDGSSFRDLSPGGGDGYWWLSGTSATDVWFVGEHGRISHHDGGGFVEHTAPTSATLWGVQAFAPDDVWVVGGTPGGGTTADNDIVLHYTGGAFVRVSLPGAPLGRSLYKVWGPSADDFYIVGEAATVWRRRAGSFTLESEPPVAGGTLFTVAGCGPSEVYAVGGDDVLRTSGDGTWEKLAVDLGGSANGVACGRPHEALIVGFGGLKQRLVEGAWIDDFGLPPWGDLHAAWADGTGTFWAVGGDFVSGPHTAPRAGIVARHGPGRVTGVFAP